MRIAVLGATGKVGRFVAAQAAERGHQVVALVRTPDAYVRPATGSVEVRRADVTAAQSFPELRDVDALISTLGISKGDQPGVLIAGAKLIERIPARTLWLGALGSGVSTGAGGGLYQGIMRMFVGNELEEKAEADAIALKAGATVFHAPDLWAGGVSEGRRNVPLVDYPRPVFPPHASRATVAALMLDQAERPTVGAEIVVPVAASR